MAYYNATQRINIKVRGESSNFRKLQEALGEHTYLDEDFSGDEYIDWITLGIITEVHAKTVEITDGLWVTDLEEDLYSETLFDELDKAGITYDPNSLEVCDVEYNNAI